MPGKPVSGPEAKANPKTLKNPLPGTSTLQSLKQQYIKETDDAIKAIDVYLLFCILNGVFQAIYYLLAGSFQYNAFLGGFISSVGSFVFAGTHILTNISV